MKRFMLILLSLSVVLGTVITGCGQPSEVSSESAVSLADAVVSEPVAEPPTQSAQEDIRSVVEESILDQEATKVSYPLTEETVELSMWIEQPNLGPLRMFGGDYGVDIYEDYSSIQYVNDLTNVQVSFENASSENASTLFNLHVAAGDWADMIAAADLYYVGGITQAFNDGVLMDIRDYLETCCPNYSAILDADADIARAATDDAGNVLQICSMLDSFMQSEGTVIRKDWLEQVNMECPTTIEELHAVLKTFQTEIGCANPFYFNSACNQLLTSYNLVYYQNLDSSDLAIYQIDGKVCSNFTAASYRSWLENMNQWYQEGLIDPDFISVSYMGFGGHDEELLAADNIGVWWANANSITNYFAMCPAETFDIVPTFITATEEPANHVTSTSRLFGSSSQVNGVAIAATCVEPELALGWLDYWYGEDGIMLANYGIEGESYEIVDGVVQYTEVITNSTFGLDPAVALKLYSIAGTSFGVQRDERTFPFYIDQQVDAVDCWTTPCDGAWAYPNVSMSTEESDTIARHSADVSTYIAECVPKFIMGELDIAAAWDSYVETVNSMGMADCLQVYQTALDRYNAA